MKGFYCEHCGKVIPNLYKMKEGNDVIEAFHIKSFNNLISKTKSKFYKFVYVLSYCLFVPSYLRGLKGEIFFCNQKHKDLFAKKIGLKIKVKE